jgi:hypothetical protein
VKGKSLLFILSGSYSLVNLDYIRQVKGLSWL